MTHSFNPYIARYRSRCYQTIRNFFNARSVLEVETPILSLGISTDCHIDVFETLFVASIPSQSQPTSQFFMQTSPELHMKRLLAQGFPDIFQISRVFRNCEKGPFHNPEFTMVEWYRIGFTMDQLIDEAVALASELLGHKHCEKLTYTEIFKQHCGFDPLTVTYQHVVDFCKNVQIDIPSLFSKLDILQLIMNKFIEPRFEKDSLTVVYHFPSDQAILAKLDEDDPRVAKRFEIYCQGIELGNGYEECADWQENQLRMAQENQKRIAVGKPTLPIDERFIKALQLGIPACAGIAMGVDRMIMLSLGLDSVGQTCAFSWDNA